MAAADHNAGNNTAPQSPTETKENNGPTGGPVVGGGGAGDEEDDSNETKKTPGDVGRSVLTSLGNFGHMLWNGEKKEFIGRTWDSWAKIGLFYLVFYSCLALFFAIMLAGFFGTLDDRAPTQKGLYSLIKSNPGMGFRPMPNQESTLIRFNQGENETYKKYIADIESFLKVYRERPESKRGKNCSSLSLNESRALLSDKQNDFCEFDLADLGTECTLENNYGYEENKPCVLLKVNKVYDWNPRPFTQAELDDPDNKLAQDAKTLLGDRLNPDYIGITCDGENEGDVDNLKGVTYYPKHGFSLKHYPYLNQPGYLPPLVFAQFNTPREGPLIQVWCRLWVSNIKHHKNDKAGSIHFELLVN